MLRDGIARGASSQRWNFAGRCPRRFGILPVGRSVGRITFTEPRRFILQRFPFSIVYLDDPDLVTIIAVAHSKRKPGYWKSRA